jgi:ABC-type branched-subunit amino acid transport system substrate-binding protein
MGRRFGGTLHLRSSRVWPALVILAGCAAAEPPPPPPPEPILEGAPIREGPFTAEEARITARLVEEGESLFESGRFTEALALADEVESSYASSPGSSQALWLQARARRELGDLEGAVEAATAYGPFIEPGSPEVGRPALFRAEVLRQGGLPGAIESLFEIPATSGEAVLADADTLAQSFASGLGTAELRDLVQEAPDHPRIHPVFLTELAVRRFLAGDIPEAQAFAEQALGRAPGPEVADRARGVLEGRVAEDLEVAATVGAILPLNGSPALTGLAEELADGIEVAFVVDEAEFPRPVRFVPVEDAADPGDMFQAVGNLESEGVAGIIGPLQDDALDALVRSRGDLVPVLSPTAIMIPPGARGVFSLNGVDPAEGEALADLLIADLRREAVVLHTASPQMAEEYRWFDEAYRARGGRVTRVLTYAPGATGFAEQMSEVMRLVPSALVMIIPPEDVELVAPQLAFYGVDRLPGILLFGNASWSSASVLAGVQARSVEGIRAVTSWFGQDEFGPGWDAFVQAYEDHFRRTLRSPTSALGYDAARLLLRAAREGGGTPEGTLRALENIRSFPGATGLLSVIDGRVRRSYVPVRIENREPVLIQR